MHQFQGLPRRAEAGHTLGTENDVVSNTYNNLFASNTFVQFAINHKKYSQFHTNKYNLLLKLKIARRTKNAFISIWLQSKYDRYDVSATLLPVGNPPSRANSTTCQNQRVVKILLYIAVTFEPIMGFKIPFKFGKS